MSSQSKVQFNFGGVAPLACHAFNAAADQVAVSKNNKEVEVFRVPSLAAAGNKNLSPPTATLDQHDLRVTGGNERTTR